MQTCPTKSIGDNDINDHNDIGNDDDNDIDNDVDNDVDIENDNESV